MLQSKDELGTEREDKSYLDQFEGHLFLVELCHGKAGLLVIFSTHKLVTVLLKTKQPVKMMNLGRKDMNRDNCIKYGYLNEKAYS